jgi:N-methylhydantoinase A
MHVGAPLGLGQIEAAAGVLKIVNTNMAVDLRLAFQSGGEDPRRFMLAAFGGAGPLHAAELARDVKIPRVLVPLYPGINSAMGLLQTSVRHVYLQSSVGFLSGFPVDRMNDLFAQLEARAMEDVREEGFAPDRVAIMRQVDMRYKHQGYQLTIDCPSADMTESGKLALKAAFDEAHQRIYGASAPDEDAEVVTFRVLAEIWVPRLELPGLDQGDGGAAHAEIGERPLYDLASAAFVPASVYDRSKLRAGDRIAGPAIVQQFDSTTVILDGMDAEVDPFGNIVIHTGAAS